AALRHGDAEEPLDRQRKGMLLIHRRYVVEAVEIGHGLKIGLVLDQLLCAAVKQAHMRIDAGHDPAVELENETEDAMGGGMLRPEIDGEGTDIGFGGRCRRHCRTCSVQYGSLTSIIILFTPAQMRMSLPFAFKAFRASSRASGKICFCMISNI